jgi:hypothetical protein
MKLALFVALVTVAAVSSYTPTSVYSSVFKPGEQYIYHYKGQVLSGVPKSTKQYAGLLIDCTVKLQFQQDYKVVMKMENIKLFKINNKITTLPVESLPESELTRLTGEQSQVISEHLVKPMKFRYDDGEVREIEKEVSDRFWSVNIKKGILSLFQVTLKEKSSTDSSFSSDPLKSKHKSSQYGSGSNSRYGSSSSSSSYLRLVSKGNTVYNVMENDVTGTCETEYTVISDKTQMSTSKLHVSTVRNFKNCIDKPFYIQGIFQGVYRFPAEKDLIQPTVHTDYIITGDRHQFLIKDVKLRGKYLFLFNGLEGGDMSTFIFQHLTLKSTEPIRAPIHLSSPKLETRGLTMIIPKATLIPEKKNFEETMSGKQTFQPRRSRFSSHQEYMKPQDLMESQEEDEERIEGETGELTQVMEKKLQELVECLYHEHPTTQEKKCSDILYELSRVMRQANKHQLKSFITRYIRNGETSTHEDRKGEILLDILPTLPSPDAVKVLIQLIKERQIPELRASLSIKAMSLVCKPTQSVIKSVLELFKELPKERTSTLSSKTLLRQSLLLGVGTLTHRLINVMRSEIKPVPELINFIDSISSELKRMLEETSSETEKILILKSLGNMGSIEIIPLLKSIVEDKERVTPVIRTNAIYALRRVCKQLGKQVIPILMSVYMDTKEPRELRQAAFVVIINSNPSYTTLQMIAHRLRHEPSNQIRTLVYSSLINLAEVSTHEPEHDTLIKNARLIIKTIPPVNVGPHDSMSVLLNQFSDKLDMGGALNIFKIKSKDSLLPEAIVANLQGTLFGKHRRLLEVGAEGKSLEVILRKIFGPHGLFKQILKGEVTLRDVLKPLTRPDMGKIESKIREILQKMMYETRSESEPFGSLYVHLLGNEIQYIVLNSQNIEEVISKVTTFLPELIMKLTRGMKVDIVKSLSNIASVTLTTPIGLPLSLNFTTMGLFKVEGHVKVNNLPTWSDMTSRFSSLQVPKLSLEADLKPFVDVSQYVSMGVNMRWITTGVAFTAHVSSHAPLKFTTHIDPVQHSVSLKVFTPKKTLKVLTVKAEPLTFVKYYPLTMNKLPFHLEKNVITAEHIIKTVPFNRKIVESISGLEIEAEGEVSLCGPTWCPTWFGRQKLSIVTRPVGSVDYVHLKMKSLKSNIELEGVPASFNTEDKFVKDTEDDEEENSEYSPRMYRTSGRSMIESGEFEPITVDPIFQNEPMKRQLLITVGSNTMHTPKVKALFTWLMGRSYWKNQVNLQVVRMGYEQMPTWKITVNNVVNPLTWNPEEISEKSEFLNKLRVLWNINGKVEEVKIKVIPGSPFDFSREVREHSILPITADTLPEANSQKYKYTVEIETPELNNHMVKYMTILNDAIKYQFYSKLATSIPHHPLNNKIIVSVELLPWWEKMNVIVKTPREDSIITDIPFYWNPFMPTTERIRLHDEAAWKWYKNTTDEEYFQDSVPYKSTPLSGYQGVCSISPERITTFDGVTVPMHTITKNWEENCEMVIAQHCSNQALFSVIGYGSDDSWKMRILVPKYEIEVSSKYSKIRLMINGEEKSISTSEPIVIREEYSESSPKKYQIEKLESGVIEIKAFELGVSVIVDSTRLLTKVKVSPFSMLQGEMCGLCGNFNQDQSDDITTESDFKPENRDFISHIKRHTISSESCNVEQIRTKSNEYCLKESHLTINRYDNDTPMTCTTERKVPQCARGCRAESTTSIKTCLTCRGEEGTTLPRKTYMPPRWETSEKGDIDCEEFYQRIEIPTRCVPVY